MDQSLSDGAELCPSKKPKGTLFTSCLIRGRGTAAKYGREPRLTALNLKVIRRDQGDRAKEEENRLAENPRDRRQTRIVLPIQFLRDLKDTVVKVKGVPLDELLGCPVENIVLAVNMPEHKRPIRFFWGVHDFVRGLRGALLGHEYLTKMGILHRDIHEDSIVLASRPEGERGYLIDSDMAKVYFPPAEGVPMHIARRKITNSFYVLVPSFSPMDDDESAPFTGAMPYMSFNVLRKGIHTHYDDIESFLYVLLLFFFSYAGPLSKEELLVADSVGFTHPSHGIGLRHMRSWPKIYTSWAKDRVEDVAKSKDALLNMEGARQLVRSVELEECLKKNWGEEELQRAILNLLETCWQMFIDSRRTHLMVWHTKVSHQQFIGVLDRWLVEFTDLEDKYSHCPFEKE